MPELRIAGVIRESVVDGPGIRFVVFTQGCPHHCPGCHNPETHPFEGGKLVDTSRVLEEILKNPLLKGATFSGGESFCQPGPLAELAKELHEKGRDVMVYSGFTFEQLCEKAKTEPDVKALLEQADVLVDGRFIEAQKSLLLKFRGSENQRILDLPQSLKEGRAVEVPWANRKGE